MTKKCNDQFRLTDKIAVITGGAGLLGRKHAEAIAEAGGTPILLDVVEDKIGNEVASHVAREYQAGCRFFRCDITDEDDIKRVRDKIVDQYMRIDILINNAAINPKVENVGSVNFSRLENFALK